jgi:hypothetical protein
MPKPKFRQRVIQTFARTCYWCKRKGITALDPDGRAWHMDRLSPGACGGKYSLGNVVLSCAACNLTRSGVARIQARVEQNKKRRSKKSRAADQAALTQALSRHRVEATLRDIFTGGDLDNLKEDFETLDELVHPRKG